MVDELSVEDILATEHDVIPLDGADVFQQAEIDSIGDRVALIEDPVELLDLEQAAADAAAQLWLREVLEDELGLEDAPEIPIGAVEPILGAEAYQPFQGN
jgi:hypothetical protein